jgi:hypothetical protein
MYTYTTIQVTALAIAAAAAAKHAQGSAGSGNGVGSVGLSRATATRRPSIFGHVESVADAHHGGDHGGYGGGASASRETQVFSSSDLRSVEGQSKGEDYMAQLSRWVHGPSPFSGVAAAAAAAGLERMSKDVVSLLERQRLRHFGWGHQRPLLLRVWEEVEGEGEGEGEEKDAMTKLVDAMMALHMRPVDLWEVLGVDTDR